MYLNNEEVNRLLNKKDLSENNEHCIKIVLDKIVQKLEEKYHVKPEIHKGNRIVSLDENYYILGYDDSEVTLGTRYTKYIDEKRILRTQMTSTIPSLLENYKEEEGNKLWLCPGLVYRRDVRDKTHVGEPHQLDIWHLTKEIQNREDLLGLVSSLINIIEECKGEKIKWRYNETSHHYTEQGIEVEIYYKNNWLEILECGLISQKLLHKYNISEHSGLALGLGLERLVMIIKDIEDIRVLYSDDLNIKKQLNNLKKYKQVSNQPATKRDLSIAIDVNMTEEELTELILSHTSEELAKKIESISIISDTKYEELPPIAIERLGILPNQKNILLRIVLRDLEKTLTHEEANDMYNIIYTKIHQGKNGYLINN